MTSQFEDFDPDRFAADSEDAVANKRFELISAYLDGELSTAEKTQVQTWLDSDPELKAIYTSMLTLQGQMQNLAAPPSNQSVGEITNKVFESLDRRQRHRRLLIAGSAIAASIVAGAGVLIPGIGSGDLRLASPNLRESQTDTVMLAVALNKPAINIPKSANGYNLGQP